MKRAAICLLVAVVLSAAGCRRSSSGALDDAGPPVPPLRFDAGPPLPPGSHFCRGALHPEWLVPVPMTEPIVSSWYGPTLGDGQYASADPAFSFAGDGVAGFVFPVVHRDPLRGDREDAAHVVSRTDLRGDPTYRPPAPATGAMGSALLFVDESYDGTDLEIVVIEPTTRSERVRRPLPRSAPSAWYSLVAVSSREGGALIARGGQLLRLDGRMRAVGDWLSLGRRVERPRLVRTDRGIVLVTPGWAVDCPGRGLATLPLDASGEPTLGPLCLEDVEEASDEEVIAASHAHWDGGRIVVLEESAVVELDAEGRFAERTRTAGTPLAAFGTADGIVALVRRRDRTGEVRLLVLERGSGVVIGDLGHSASDLRINIVDARAAVTTGQGFVLLQDASTDRLHPIRVRCE